MLESKHITELRASQGMEFPIFAGVYDAFMHMYMYRVLHNFVGWYYLDIHLILSDLIRSHLG